MPVTFNTVEIAGVVSAISELRKGIIGFFNLHALNTIEFVVDISGASVTTVVITPMLGVHLSSYNNQMGNLLTIEKLTQGKYNNYEDLLNDPRMYQSCMHIVRSTFKIH